MVSYKLVITLIPSISRVAREPRTSWLEGSPAPRRPPTRSRRRSGNRRAWSEPTRTVSRRCCSSKMNSQWRKKKGKSNLSRKLSSRTSPRKLLSRLASRQRAPWWTIPLLLESRFRSSSFFISWRIFSKLLFKLWLHRPLRHGRQCWHLKSGRFVKMLLLQSKHLRVRFSTPSRFWFQKIQWIMKYFVRVQFGDASIKVVMRKVLMRNVLLLEKN